MNAIEQQIIETWQINHRTNILVLQHITEETLSFSTNPRGGNSIGHQFAHMYNVRFWKLQNMERTLAKDLKAVKAKDEKTLEMLTELHEHSTALIEKVIVSGIENDGIVKGFKRGLIPMLGYFIHHEAHHRGNILLTLKRCGFKLPEALKYGIWEWNKL